MRERTIAGAGDARFDPALRAAPRLLIYTHLFDEARHATEIRTRMASSSFARLLEPDGEQADNVVRDRPAASADRRRDGAPAEGPALDR
jgi:hypothetical protein